MHIVLVHVHVKPEAVEDFKRLTLENARNSIQEPGITRFDVLQQKEEPTRFTLIEVYRKPEDQEAHRQTAHYLRWRDAVTDMMAENRIGVRYVNLYPDEPGWEK